jgi:hypothetical protein
MKKFLLPALFLVNTAIAQPELTMPESSQQASVTQRIGLSDISISYHSPRVKGRTIWGDVVPYDAVWRAGANENTIITFSSDVKVEGQPLAAGTYGLHMIPSQKEWTVIFSKNSSAWGSYFYNEKEDALRVKVLPESAPAQEWLSYTFASPEENSVKVLLRWEKIAVPFKITIDVPEVVYQSMKKELSGLNGFYWQSYNTAAEYCILNNIHLDDAAAWADRSLKSHEGFANLNTKANLLEKQGQKDKAEALRKKALDVGTEGELNAYGYQLMNEGRLQEAVEVFKLNARQHPASWNVYDSLGDALKAAGDKKAAIENFNKALSKAPEDQKKRIKDIIAKLSS